MRPHIRRSRHTLCAAMPSPLPVKPSFSSVVALTETSSAEMPSAAARFSRIAGIYGASFGAWHKSVASMLPAAQPARGVIAEDPADNLKPPKVEKRAPEILTIEEVDKLLQQPKLDTPKGIRDSAMLELLYATGMRVSEMLHLQIFDVNLQFGYVVCNENGKERIIPIGIPCKKAMERYLQTARTVFVKDEKETALFTNCSGKAMSRQGFWKVLKGYADDAGIKRDIAPHTLRHSFAVHMLQNGADIRSVQEMLGHSDISTTQVYLGMNMNKMRDVYMKTHPRH